MSDKLTAVFADLAAAAISLEKKYSNDQDFGRNMRNKIKEILKSSKNEARNMESVQDRSK